MILPQRSAPRCRRVTSLNLETQHASIQAWGYLLQLNFGSKCIIYFNYISRTLVYLSIRLFVRMYDNHVWLDVPFHPSSRCSVSCLVFSAIHGCLSVGLSSYIQVYSIFIALSDIGRGGGYLSHLYKIEPWKHPHIMLQSHAYTACYILQCHFCKFYFNCYHWNMLAI